LKRYEHIYFDLDHTLWDFERNSEETISELYLSLKIEEKGVQSARHLYESFEKANRWAWDQYHLDLLDKETLRINRFEIALAENGVQDKDFSETLAWHYLNICPTKPHLVDGTLEILEYLVDKFPLHLISNGFDEITQTKVDNTSIRKYFKSITTPSNANHKKPENGMFQFALSQANCIPEKALMIGDDIEADILGAQRCGIDQVLFNPNKRKHGIKSTFEIFSLNELKTIL